MLNIFKKKEEKINVHLGDCSVESVPSEGKNLEACIFIGKSGCGKGTQVNLYMKKLEEINGLKTIHIETGSLLRALVKTGSYTGQKTAEIIETGNLMPESIVIGLWVNHLTTNFTNNENLVFDGAPRRLTEAELLHSTLSFYKIPKYKVVYINVSNEWATARLLGRARKDDTKEAIEKRMTWFNEDVVPCIEFFKKQKNCEVIEINGEQTIEKVSEEVISKIFKK